tara:strand:+ start:1136 stop:1417 length:282 start_codon:yes stop_codon:yes gene_type:complete
MKNNKAPKSIEASVLQVVDVGNKQGMSICLMRSKVNLSSTKYEINGLRLHFVSTNVYLGLNQKIIMDDLGKKTAAFCKTAVNVSYDFAVITAV